MTMRRAVFAALILCLAGGRTDAQDFRKVVQIVDEMETSLRKMITREESERKTEIASLRNEVVALQRSLAAVPEADRSAVSTAGSIAGVEELARRVEVLEKRMGGVPQQSDMTSLAGQLSTLVAELKKVVAEPRPSQEPQIKHNVPVPPTASIWTFGGQIRERTEVEGKTFVADARAIPFHLLRSRLNVTVKPSDDIMAMVQVQDSRVFGGETSSLSRGTQDGMSKAIDFHQAYFAVSNLFNSGVGMKIGRQEMTYGNERLISQTDWTGYGRAFDAIRLTYEADGSSVHLFTSRLVGSQTSPIGENFHGLYSTLAFWKPALFDVFLLFDNNSTEITKGVDKGESRLVRTTYGLMAHGKPGVWDYQVETIFQGGKSALTDTSARAEIKASLFSALLGFTIDPATKLRVSGLLTVMSGDNTPKDNEATAFSMVFGSGHKFYGYMDLETKTHPDNGIVDASLSIGSNIGGEALSLVADVHQFGLDRGVVFKDPSTGAPRESKDMGTEIDLTANLKYNAFLRFIGGFSVFVPGEAMRAVRGPSTAYWGFLSGIVTF